MVALQINPRNVKAHYRMASALFAIHRLAEAAVACRAGLMVDSINTTLTALQAKILEQQKAVDVKQKKAQEDADIKRRQAITLAQALKARQIKIQNTNQPPEMKDAEIKLVPDPMSLKSTLVFPVVILYPLHLQSDFIKAFGEEQTLQGHLEYLLPLPWDTTGEYSSNEAYMETVSGGLIKLGKKVELLKVLSGGKVEIVDGLIKVNLVPKSRASEWIESFKKSRPK